MKSALTLMALTLVGVSLLVASGSAGFRQDEKEIATPIREGVMTERQREHSKLYQQYRTDKKLRDINVPGTSDVKVGAGTSLPMGDPSAAPFNRNSFLMRLACNADAVLVGLVNDKTSQLTEDEGFIFTDYGYVVEAILKNNGAAPAQVNDAITITRPGGAVRLNGRVFRAEDESFKMLSVNTRYVMFLRYIRATGAYQAINSKATFGLLKNGVQKLTSEWTGLENENDTAQFLGEVQAAANNCKAEKGEASSTM